MSLRDIPTEYILAGMIVIGAGAVAAVSVGGNQSQAASGTAVWMNTTLDDVNSNDTYAIASFDKPVLIETFAVWCTVCTRQQQEVEKLHERRDDFVSVSLNTDPGENEKTVRRHTQQHGFDWRYSVAPASVVESLVDEFGSSITIAPQAPMILLCPDGSRERLPNGPKPASQLNELLNQGC